MCGFVAVITPDRHFPQGILNAMRDRLIHRGPDGGHSWMEETPSGVIALGHRRLSIIDLSPAGIQPMFGRDDRHVIVFNGEIYNYIELREELKTLGHKFRSESDTEVLLAAYAQWGVDCLPHLNGMFAFALWDRNRKQLFVARDRFGEKPVYFTRMQDGGIAFASEVKALFAHPAIKPAARQDKIDLFLGGSTSYGSSDTFFVGVERLQGAHAILLDSAGREVKRWRYWTPDYDDIRPVGRVEDTIDEFRALLVQSVKMRLRTDVHVGACLSGGLDSSTLVGIISKLEQNGSALFSHTYSARFDDDPTMSEGNYIDCMRKFSGLSAQSVSPEPLTMAAESERLHWHQEQPFFSASMYLEWCVTRKARETGTVVMLDGQGADEVLAGYHYNIRNYQYDQLLRGHWIDLYKNTTRFNRRIRAEMLKYHDGLRRIDPNAAYDFKDFGFLMAHGALSLTSKTIRKRYPVAPGLPYAMPANTFRYKIAKGVLYDTLASNLHSADCNGMAHSIETRFPFLDYRLVDWCTRLPSNLMIHDGWTKYILRRAVQGVIPDQIRWRVDKVGFAAPQDTWLRQDMRDWAGDRLFSGPITKQQYYNRKTIERQWAEHQSGAYDHSWDLWRHISMNEWLNLFENNTWQTGLQPNLTRRGVAAVGA